MSQRLASLRAALRPHLIPILLLATLLAAAALRFYALDWDRGHFFHPDERAIMEATVKVGLPVPFKLSSLLSPQSPLNPKFFAYGSLPFYLTKATASFLGRFQRSFLEYGNIRLVGRAYSVLFDLGTIVLIYLLGKKLYDRRAGLLAAVFVAFSVLHIQLAHFYAVDGVLTFFIVLAVYLAVDVMRSGSLGRSALLGASVGLALASKFSAAPVLLTVVVAWGIYVIRGSQSAVLSPEGDKSSSVDRLAKAIIGLTIAGLCFLVVFFIGEPYAFIDWPSFIKRILDEGAMARGLADLPYTRQYINTTAYLYQIKNALLVSYGLPLGLAAFAGLAWATVVAIFRRRPGEIVVLSWVLVYFAIDGAFQVKFLRYMLPLLPFLSLFAAQAMLSWRDYFARARTPAEAAIVPTSAQPIEVGPTAMPLAPAEPAIELEELPLDWEERLELDPPAPAPASGGGEGLSHATVSNSQAGDNPSGLGWGSTKSLLALLVLWIGIVFVSLVRWTQMTTASQGRLLFVALPAIAILFFAGLTAWVPKRSVGLSLRLTGVVAALVGMVFFITAAIIPFRTIAPAYARPAVLASIDEATIPQRVHVTYGDQAELIGYALDREAVRPGEALRLTLYWRALARLDKDYSLYIHLFGWNGQRVGQRDSYPGGGAYPTRLWQPGDILVDSYLVSIAPTATVPSQCLIEVGLYDRATMERLPVRDGVGRPITSPLIGRCKLAAIPATPSVPNAVDYRLGDQAALVGYEVNGGQVPAVLKPGDSLRLVLYWQAMAKLDRDYTVFVHLEDKAQRIWGQKDSEPQAGNYPTSLWDPGEVVRDERDLIVAPDAPPGDYELAVGLYLVSTGERLPVTTADGLPLGNHLVLDQVQVVAK